MVELADIFRSYGPKYQACYGKSILPSHQRALNDIAQCRTEAMGGHLVMCSHCSTKDYTYHSCKNRSCPKCHSRDTEKWLEKRQADLLPVTYFHLVFTLPKQLRRIVRSHQKVMYSILMRAAAQALMLLATDPKYIGGKIGILAVLHTWTRAMVYHPHVHCLVPGGGLSQDATGWLSAHEKFLVPVKALSPIFRAKFLEMAKKALPDVAIPHEVWDKDWVVYCKPTVQGAEKVLQYLGRYVHRIAITNHRILAIKNGEVIFCYKDAGNKKQKPEWRTMSLSAMEFIRRFLQHVPPRGFHKVRYYGLLSPVNRHRLIKIQNMLTDDNQIEPPTEAEVQNDSKPDCTNIPCRFCGKGIMIIIKTLLPIRGPP